MVFPHLSRIEWAPGDRFRILKWLKICTLPLVAMQNKSGNRLTVGLHKLSSYTAFFPVTDVRVFKIIIRNHFFQKSKFLKIWKNYFILARNLLNSISWRGRSILLTQNHSSWSSLPGKSIKRTSGGIVHWTRYKDQCVFKDSTPV